MPETLPPEIEKDLGDLISASRRLGFIPVSGEFDAKHFGNFVLDLKGPSRSVRVVRDRLQYFVEGERTELEPLGLFRAFDDKAEFTRCFVNWLDEGA